MDISSVAAPVVSKPVPAPVVKTDSNASSVSSDPQPAPVQRAEPVAKVELTGSDEQRLAAVRVALTQALKNTYAVSDTSVSLFKDSSGQLITRFTSLRDGTVTYMPEPDLVKHLSYAGYDMNKIKMSV